MITSGNERNREATDRSAPDSARLPFADAAHFSEALANNPFLAQPAAAMAAATAIGFGIASQMANAFFGVMQTALEATNRQAPVTPEVRPSTRRETVAPTTPEVTATVVKAKAPVRKKAEKPAVVAVKLKSEAAQKAKTARRGVGSDLKRISGIGPKLETVLKGKGVANIAQIAAWTDEDVARFEQELGLEGRIGRDDWVGQAKALVK
ncbi:5' DNA nuclease [Rhizobium sp. NTR19]|uniref:5' DNA nuclease n=1 Tax=Neorhizobium turbinariae TaxID=2937795 RepID=A0ABT0IUK3_9HYPH|nr:5' DNA nuclease [Neorhizobium turbinariae]MCK8781494.1 5' DNA nuclease [Neorhizobium turbinariae]